MDFKPLYELRLFNLEEFRKAMGMEGRKEKSTLLHLRMHGMVQLLRRELYCMKDMSTGQLMADRFEIACHVSEGSYLSFQAALDYHGLTREPVKQVYISGGLRFYAFDDGLGTTFHYCRDVIGPYGLMRSPKNPVILTSNIERTFVDCLDRIDRAGGLDNFLYAIDNIRALDEDNLKDYLDRYALPSLYHKAGFLLERVSQNGTVSSDFIDFCLQHVNTNTKRLTDTEDCDVHVKRWNLWVPSRIMG